MVEKSKFNWREEPFRLNLGGVFIKPPPVPEMTQEQKELEHKNEKRNRKSRSRSTSRHKSSQKRRRYSRSRSRSFNRSRRRRASSRSPSRDRKDRDHRYQGMTGAQIERARTKDRIKMLSRLSVEDYQEWKNILRELNFSKISIKRAMGFAFDKIESSEEIIELIKENLIISSDYGSIKLIGMYLLSDILHNSASPIKHASNYKFLIEGLLPELFIHIGEFYRKTSGRMTAFNIEERVKKLISAWKSWSIFTFQFINGLESTFYMNESDIIAMNEYVSQKNNENSSSAQEVGSTSNKENDLESLRKRAKQNGIYFNDKTSRHEIFFRLNYAENYLMKSKKSIEDEYAQFKIEEKEDIDGEPLENEDYDPSDAHIFEFKKETGSKLDDIDGEIIDEDEIDGEPLEDLDSIDGEPMDEDIDGVPIDI